MFGKRLREARMEKGITQQLLAERVGISLRNYQAYEQGARRPTFETLVGLADELDVSTDWLLGRDDFLAGEAPSDL